MCLGVLERTVNMACGKTTTIRSVTHTFGRGVARKVVHSLGATSQLLVVDDTIHHAIHYNRSKTALRQTGIIAGALTVGLGMG
jgi:hypothetical protein